MIKRTVLTLAVVATSAATLPSRAATILATIPVDRGPAAFAVHPQTGVVYVGNVTDGTVAVLAGAAKVATISVANPTGLAVDGENNKLYVASYEAGKVFVYSTISNARIGEITVGGNPWGLDVDQTTGRVFVANFAANALNVIQPGALSGSTIALPGCGGPIGVAFNAATSRTFVTCIYSGNVAVVDGNLAVRDSIDIGLGTYPWGIASHPSASSVYVGNWSGGHASSGSVSVIDAEARALLTTASTGGAPIGLAVSRGGTPYAALSAVNRLGILNPATGAVEETVDLPTDQADGMNEPHAVAVAPMGTFVYVGNYHAESVSVVSTFPRP